MFGAGVTGEGGVEHCSHVCSYPHPSGGLSHGFHFDLLHLHLLFLNLLLLTSLGCFLGKKMQHSHKNKLHIEFEFDVVRLILCVFLSCSL